VRRAALAAALALLGLPAVAPAGITGFKTPSKNIFCAYIAFEGVREMRCDISTMTSTPPPKPDWCEFDWGMSFGMTPTSRGHRLCVSDTPMDPKFPTLAHGKTWKHGGISCRSRTSGLRCTNKRDHGFFLSRAKQTLF
jgi:hypothetical protein